MQQEPSEILIIRLSAIGDVIMASGLIPALRARYPNARLSWLVEPVAAPLLRDHPDLHAVIEWPRQQWQEQWRAGDRRGVWQAFKALRRELRGHQFDWALDVQRLLKSGIWTRLSGAKYRIAIAPREGSRWLVNERFTPQPGDRRMSSEYRQLAVHLGCRDEDFRVSIPISDSVRQRAEALRPADRYAVFCPFTTRPQKHWFDERWVTLGKQLRDATGLTPLILGGPADRDHAETICHGIGEGATHLAGRASLIESAAVIDQASLMIGVDTGLTHLGTGYRIPTLALFGSTRPYLETDSDRTRVLYHRLGCSPCRRRPTCGGEFTCMRRHEVQGVMEHVEALLA